MTSGAHDSCREVIFQCSNTDIVKIDCGVGGHSVCEDSNFYISNVNEFELSIGDNDGCRSCNFLFDNICFVSFSYYDYDVYNAYESDWEFNDIDMIYGDLQFWWHICSNGDSGIMLQLVDH